MSSRVDLSRPDSPDLTTDRVSYLRSLLLSENAEHATRLVDLRASAADLVGQADGDSLSELLEAAAERAVESIADIQHALACIEAHTYGACEACGEDIPFLRLEAIPHARHCVACSRPEATRLR